MPESMPNGWMVTLFPCDQKLAEPVLHMRQLKEDNERTKT